MTRHELELSELRNFFEKATFPAIPFRLNKYMTVSGDPKLFLSGQFLNIERYNGSEKVLDSLFVHLRELKEIIEKQHGNENS